MKKQLLSLIAFAFISLTVSAQITVNPDILEQRYIFGTTEPTPSDDPTALTFINILRDVDYTKTAEAQPSFNGTYEQFNSATTSGANFIDLSLQSTVDIPNAELGFEVRQRVGGLMTVTVTVDGNATVFSDLDETSPYYDTAATTTFRPYILPIENISFTNGVAKTIKIDVFSTSSAGGNTTQIRVQNVRVINNDVVLSTKDFITENGIKLYPNPATDNFELSSRIDVKSVEVFNITGQLVKTLESVTNKYDISDLKSGLYLATINTDSGSGTIKLVKE